MPIPSGPQHGNPSRGGSPPPHRWPRNLVRQQDLHLLLLTDPHPNGRAWLPCGASTFSPSHFHTTEVGPTLGTRGPHRAQILGRALDGRPYFLDEREHKWANPTMKFPLPQSRTHAFIYLRALLSSRAPYYQPRYPQFFCIITTTCSF